VPYFDWLILVLFKVFFSTPFTVSVSRMILNDELKRISISWLMSEHAPGRSKDSSDKPQDSQPRNRELNLWHTEHEAMMLSIAQERPVLLW